MKMRKGRFCLCRNLIAIFVSFSLILSQSVSFAALPVTVSTQAETITVPKEWGNIEESFSGETDKTIVYLQDAHDSLEAQENIARIIRYFVKHHGVETVFEEGYEGPVPTDDYFGFIHDKTLKEKVSYFLMDRLRIGGAEYAHVNREKDFKLIGADKIRLHLKNNRSYREAKRYQKETAVDLSVLQIEAERLAHRNFPSKLKEWVKLKKRFDEKKLGLLNYLERTLNLMPSFGAEVEESGDYPNITLLLAGEKDREERVLAKVKAMDVTRLFGEIDRLEDDLASRLLLTEKNRILFHDYKVLSLLNTLNQLKMTPAQYEAVKKQLKNFDTQALGRFVVQENHRPIVLSRRWELHLRHAIQFYEISRQRDRFVDARLESFLNHKEEKFALLIFGGFHKDRIKAMLRRKKVSYWVLSPRITQKDEKHQKLYQKLMAQGFSMPSQVPEFPQASRLASQFEQGETGGTFARRQLLAYHRLLAETLQRLVAQQPAVLSFSPELLSRVLEAEMVKTRRARSEVRNKQLKKEGDRLASQPSHPQGGKGEEKSRSEVREDDSEQNEGEESVSEEIKKLSEELFHVPEEINFAGLISVKHSFGIPYNNFYAAGKLGARLIRLGPKGEEAFFGVVKRWLDEAPEGELGRRERYAFEAIKYTFGEHRSYPLQWGNKKFVSLLTSEVPAREKIDQLIFYTTVYFHGTKTGFVWDGIFKKDGKVGGDYNTVTSGKTAAETYSEKRPEFMSDDNYSPPLTEEEMKKLMSPEARARSDAQKPIVLEFDAFRYGPYPQPALETHIAKRLSLNDLTLEYKKSLVERFAIHEPLPWMDKDWVVAIKGPGGKQHHARSEVRSEVKSGAEAWRRTEAVISKINSRIHRPSEEKYAVLVDLDVFDGLAPQQKEEFYKLFAVYHGTEKVKFVFWVPGERRMDVTLSELMDFEKRFDDVEIRINPETFDFRKVKILNVSKEGISSFYAADAEKRFGRSKDFYSVRYRRDNQEPGLLTAAILLLNSGREEFFGRKGYFSEVPAGFRSEIRQYLMSYVYIKQSA